MTQLKREIAELSAEERLSLVEAIWDDLIREPEQVPVPKGHLDEIRVRLADHDAHPDDVVDWKRLGVGRGR